MGQVVGLNFGSNFRVANRLACAGNFGFRFRDHILSSADGRLGVRCGSARSAFSVSLRWFWASHRVSSNGGTHARSDERAKEEVAKRALAEVV